MFVLHFFFFTDRKRKERVQVSALFRTFPSTQLSMVAIRMEFLKSLQYLADDVFFFFSLVEQNHIECLINLNIFEKLVMSFATKFDGHVNQTRLTNVRIEYLYLHTLRAFHRYVSG